MGITFRAALGFVLCASTFAARPARAEDELQLEQLVAVAVRQSPELERARIDLDAARAALLRAEGIEDLHVGARASVSALRTHATDADGRDLVSDAQLIGVDLSVRRAMPTGGTVGIVVAGDRSHNAGSSDAEGNLVTEGYAASFGVQLVHPLWRGAGPSVYEAPIRQAAQQRDAAVLGRQARARDHVVALVQAYWQVSFARRQLEVRKASLELAQQQLIYTEGAIRSEKVARSEAVAVQQAIAIRKQDVIAGEQELLERSVALRQLGGLEIAPDALEVRTALLPDKVDAAARITTDVAAAVRGAFDHSAELAAIEAGRRAAEIAVTAADGAARSQLDLDVTAGPVGTDAAAGKAVSKLFDKPGYSVTASLTFDRAIQRRTERGGQAAARAELSRAKVAEREARARLAVRATRAAQRIQAALASIELGDQAISLADQNITAEKKRFELGKSTNFEVLRRQDELELAKLRHAAAIADYLAARADLDGLSGAILARFGIVMR